MYYHVLYNPYSDNNMGKYNAMKLREKLENDFIQFKDITQISNISEYIDSVKAEDAVLIAGGDGTLNHFINDVDCENLSRDIYFYPTGTGNDFINDINVSKRDLPIIINDYLKNLPTVTVNGQTLKFINGVGYGLDGYCCKEADRRKSKSSKKVNYTAIALKGLSYAYHPTNAKVFIDGIEFNYSKVWLAPTMKGRYFGGGMMPTPNQNRFDNCVSVMIYNGAGKIKTLLAFPGILKGTHIKNKKVNIFKCNDVTVQFDRPTALQVDGETFLNVSEYSVTTKVLAYQE